MTVRALGICAALILGPDVPANAQADGDWAFTLTSGAVLELPKSPSIESALGYLDYQPGEPVFRLLAASALSFYALAAGR